MILFPKGCIQIFRHVSSQMAWNIAAVTGGGASSTLSFFINIIVFSILKNKLSPCTLNMPLGALSVIYYNLFPNVNEAVQDSMYSKISHIWALKVQGFWRDLFPNMFVLSQTIERNCMNFENGRSSSQQQGSVCWFESIHKQCYCSS